MDNSSTSKRDTTRARTADVSPIELQMFEYGDMDEEEIISLFQRLVDSGLVWRLQGFYGRTAAHLIRLGVVMEPRIEADITE